MTKHLAVEWGPDGVRVNCISPGAVADTEGFRRLGQYFLLVYSYLKMQITNFISSKYAPVNNQHLGETIVDGKMVIFST